MVNNKVLWFFEKSCQRTSSF